MTNKDCKASKSEALVIAVNQMLTSAYLQIKYTTSHYVVGSDRNKGMIVSSADANTSPAG